MKFYRFLAVLLSTVLVFSVLPVLAEETVYTKEFDLSSAEVSITSAGTYRVTTTSETANAVKISNAGKVTLVLDSVTVRGANISCVQITNSDVTVELVGENILNCTAEKVAGGIVLMDAVSKVTVQGEGSLTAEAGLYTAAIGTKADLNSDQAQIVINSGTVIARAVSNSAAIGGGRMSGAQITINGGTITATATTNGAGIGAGRGATFETESLLRTNVVINNGDITATGGGNSAGIGGSYLAVADVTINGGTVRATGTGGAGIGAGTGSAETLPRARNRVTITGGNITATGGVSSAGIGGSFYTVADVSVSGGVVNAYSAHPLLKGIDSSGVNCTSGDGERLEGALSITGGALYSFNNSSQKEEELSPETAAKLTVAVPDGANAPYTMSVNGISQTFDALNDNGVLNLYVRAAERYTAILTGAETFIASTDGAAVGSGEWSTALPGSGVCRLSEFEKKRSAGSALCRRFETI